MCTPVAPTPESDLEQVRLSHENPHRFDERKRFARSHCQFAKWTPNDFVGFFGCRAIVAGILFFL